MKIFRWFLLFVLVSVALFSACEDSTGPRATGQFQLLITDAAADYLSSATVCISEAYLQPAEEPDGDGVEGTRLPLPLAETGIDKCEGVEGAVWEFDLLLLQGGLTTPLTETVAVEAGSYHQLRLIVKKAFVVLAGDLVDEDWEGFTFDDGTHEKELFVPSGMQTGIKVNLLAPITIEEDELTEVTVDFDVNDNFVIQGNPDPESGAGIKGILFTPVLKEIDRSEGEG